MKATIKSVDSDGSENSISDILTGNYSPYICLEFLIQELPVSANTLKIEIYPKIVPEDDEGKTENQIKQEEIIEAFKDLEKVILKNTVNCPFINLNLSDINKIIKNFILSSVPI